MMLMVSSSTKGFQGLVMQHEIMFRLPCNPLIISKFMVVSKCYNKYHKIFLSMLTHLLLIMAEAVPRMPPQHKI
jgi:hypothetical protein